jgi:hypothetical protein
VPTSLQLLAGGRHLLDAQRARQACREGPVVVAENLLKLRDQDARSGRGGAFVLERLPPALGSGSPFARGFPAEQWMPRPQRGRQRRSRRARAGCGAPLGEGCGGAGRSRSRSARAGDRERGDNCFGQRVRNILKSEDAKPNRPLEAGRLRRVTALGASSQARPRGGCEPQPAVWAASLGHGDPGPFLPGRPWPHREQTPLITGSAACSSSISKYTRCRPRPDTRRTCPHSGQL